MWAEARPLIELIVAAHEPIAVGMVVALLGWDNAQQARVLEATGLLFPVRDGKFHVFHKTIVDWLTAEIAEGSSVKQPAADFHVERGNGHGLFAAGFTVWLGGARAEDAPYWLRHGVSHLCHAGRAQEAAEVYATDLGLLCQRLDAGLLASVATDHIVLTKSGAINLEAAL